MDQITKTNIDNDAMFRKYLDDTCNNVPMVDYIINLHKTSGTDREGNSLFAEELYKMLRSVDLCQTICNIRDMVYDLGHVVEVDPSYNDAVVEHEARPKNDTLVFIARSEPQGIPLADQMQAMKQSYHDRVFNPLNTQYRQETPYEKLEREIFAHH